MNTEAPRQAGRCVAVIRPHRWTHWRVLEATKGPFNTNGPIFQMRMCIRCGRTQMTGVMVSK